MPGAGLFAPPPAVVVPEFRAAIPAFIDEGGEPGIGHRRAGDAEGRHGDRVGPFFVVEHEGRIPGGAEQERAARHVDVAGQRAGVRVRRPTRPVEPGFGVAQGLARVGIGLVVHVLVEGGELVEVAVLLTRHRAVQTFEQGPEDVLHVHQDLVQRRQGQVPAGVVGDADGIVDGVPAGEQGGTAVHAPENEEFVEPRHVPDLPHQRIDDLQLRADKLLVVQSPHQFQRPCACVAHDLGQVGRRHRLGHGPPSIGIPA